MNYQRICDEITSIAIKCGRNPTEITLIAVTKQVEWPKIFPLYAQGQRDFGENRVHEALEKQIEAPGDCQWHFIGNLQKNKIRKIIGKFKLIHSVDSLDLAQKISEISLESNLITNILLQTNTSGEISKNGFQPIQLKSSFEEICKLRGVSVQGLMTMAPLTQDTKALHACFKALRKLRDELHLPHLSMGMSNDFKVAIEEGATFLRIGTALFS
jgi:pyridoxal phosphate enzyme (YggS family)